MGCCGVSLAEAYVYATCFLLGVSMLMPLNAVTSAPAYMIQYYKYVTGNENAVPNSKLFWDNILTFYNLISVPTQIIVGPTVLLPWARKFSLNFRFIFALTLMMLEVLVILLMPVGRSSQTGAIVAFVIVTIAAGAGKSYLEATCYALVGPMDPKFMSTIMFGCGSSGVIVSVIQCIIKASMADDYDSVLKQAYIYFSLSLAFMAVALGMAVCLRFNTYAQTYVGEYRVAAIQRGLQPAGDQCEDGTMQPAGLANNSHSVGANEPQYDPADTHSPTLPAANEEAFGRIVLDDGGQQRERKSDDGRGAAMEVKSAAGEEDDVVRVVEPAEIGMLSEEDGAERNMTTAEQMQRTRVWPVVKLIWPMQLSCFLVFFVSLFIFPSLILPIDRSSKWFSTIAILIYNCGDALGRFSTSLRFLWPSRKVLLTVSFVRFAFIPLIFLCIYQYIPSHVAPCVFIGCVGLTNGFFGATSMVFGPQTKGLRTDGQRVMAGQLMGIALLAGASLAALLAMLVILVIDK